MKKMLYVLSFITIFLILSTDVIAKTKTYTYKDFYIDLDKDNCSIVQEDGERKYKCTINKFKLHGIDGEKASTSLREINLYTFESDEVMNNSDKFWANLTVCTIETLASAGTNITLAKVYTSSSLIDNKLFTSIERECFQYNVSDTDEEDKVHDSCELYSKYHDEIEENVESYIASTNQEEKLTYKNEYNKNVDHFKNVCSQMMSFVNSTDPCVKRCLELQSDVKAWNRQMGNSGIGGCGFSDTLLAWIKNIIRVIKYIIPVIVIVFGIVDFIKAIASDKDDEMKKAQGRFIKRLIAAALIFIVPFIIEFILDKAGFINDECAVDLLGKIGL